MSDVLSLNRIAEKWDLLIEEKSLSQSSVALRVRAHQRIE